MSATMRTLTYGVIVEDHQHWTDTSVAACDRSRASTYDDWVIDQLDDAIREAAQCFIAANPDLFCSTYIT